MKVVPMTTSLGFEDMPTVMGPPVPTLEDAPKDARSVFVTVGLFKKGLMPSDPLTTQHVEWLSNASAGIDVCRADYLNAQQSLDDDVSQFGVTYTEEELAACAGERRRTAAAGRDRCAANPNRNPNPNPNPDPTPTQLLRIGNLHVVKELAPGRRGLWTATMRAGRRVREPDDALLLRSHEPELNQPAPAHATASTAWTSSSLSDGSDARAHLAWLAGAAAAPGRCASSLGEDAGNGHAFVNGDELDEVRRWASEPTTAQGLFESVLVALLTQYALSAGKLAGCSPPPRLPETG